MITVNNEKWRISLYRRKENSAYEYETTPYYVCKGRPASKVEKKNYRLQQGVNSSTDSVYVICSNLPISNIKPQDIVVFMGKQWTIESIGFYFDNALVVNPSLFSDDYVAKRCPKGLTLI